MYRIFLQYKKVLYDTNGCWYVGEPTAIGLGNVIEIYKNSFEVKVV